MIKFVFIMFILLQSWLRILIDFLKPPVTQGLNADFFLVLLIFKDACPLLILLKMRRNLDTLSFVSLLLFTREASLRSLTHLEKKSRQTF